MNSIVTPPKRALIIRAGRLGDTVWGTTAIEPVRSFLGGQVMIDIIVVRGMRALFEHDPRIDTIYEIEHRGIPLPFSPTKLAVLGKSLLHPYDLVVNLETSAHFSGLMRCVRSRRKICTSTLPPAEQRLHLKHNVEFIRYVLAQGMPEVFCRQAAPSLRYSEQIDVGALLGTDREYLCLHPGNSLLARGKPALRSWPAANWQELVALIAREMPELQIVLIGEKSERELSEAIAATLPGVINLAGRTSLQQLMAVLARSRALVTTDTGPAHVAAALATPVIAIFGPSDAHNTGPFASTDGWAVAVTKDAGCSPCVNTERARTCSDNVCMRSVTAAEIVRLLESATRKRETAPIVHLDGDRDTA